MNQSDQNTQQVGSFHLTPQLVLGLLVIGVGLLFLLDNLDLLRAREYLRYWPVLLVLFGLSKMIQPSGTPGRFAGLLFTVAGGLLLLDKFHVLEIHLWDFWPIVLVFVGGSMIWRASSRSKQENGISRPTDSASTLNGFAFIGGLRRNSNAQDFRGGELTAIMGGCEVDLRQASIGKEDAVLDVLAFWGGIEISVPEDWSVVIQGTPLLGGFDDKTRAPKGGSEKRLVIKGFAIMGGVEVKN
jgi:predicted membrane protein